MNWPNRSLSCTRTKRLNEMLVSKSQKVLSGIRATRDSRSAITSYLRTSRLSPEPSPNHEPAGTAAKVSDLPEQEALTSFTSPSMTPTQALA